MLPKLNIPMRLDTLPYPYRIERHPAFVDYLSSLQPYWGDLLGPDFFSSLDGLIARICGQDSSPQGREFQSLFSGLLHHRSSFNAGPIKSLFIATWWLRHCRTLIEATPTLMQSMVQTDFDKVPASFFRLPFPAVFVQLPPLAEIAIQEYASPYRRYPLDGVFLAESPPLTREQIASYRKGLEFTHLTMPCDDTLFREIFYSFHGLPAAIGADVQDDYFVMGSIILPCHNDTFTLADAVHFSSQLRRSKMGSLVDALTNDTVTEDTARALAHVAKVILYMALPEYRPIKDRSHTQALALAQAKKNPTKQAKAIRQARGLYDRILVDDRSPPSPPHVDSTETKRGVRGHWRRGHFHTVLHGEGRRERRLAWFRPTLVAGTSPIRGQTVYQVGRTSSVTPL
ncbi:MAG: hypothetical protein ACYDEV_00480 [Acidiferrobacter sp.]